MIGSARHRGETGRGLEIFLSEKQLVSLFLSIQSTFEFKRGPCERERLEARDGSLNYWGLSMTSGEVVEW